MLDTIIEAIRNVSQALFLLMGTAAIALIGLVTLQQVGKHNRSTKDKIHHASHKVKRSVLKKVFKAADKHDVDDVAVRALDRIGSSYITTFFNDVERGCRVLTNREDANTSPVIRTLSKNSRLKN